MIMLLSESLRYLSYFEDERGKKLEKIEEQTIEGNIEIYLGDDIIFINNMGLDMGNGHRNTPLIIAGIIEKYKVNALGMVTKVGGINKSFNVGDVVIVEDYIDMTNTRCKSYLCHKEPKLKLRYAMDTPFCSNWKKKFIDEACNNHKWKGNLIQEATYICTEGPAFESKAEVNMFRYMGADVVGHWISPFVYYARELNVCFLSIGVVSNIYHKNQNDMDDSEENNHLFSELYDCIYKTYENGGCRCQSQYIIQNEMY